MTELVDVVASGEDDGPFRFDDGEVVAARFVGSEELDTLLKQARWCPDSLALVMPRIGPRLAP
jgi:hypothetical protein